MTGPGIVDATPDECARARELCRAELAAAIAFCARELIDQSLSIKALMARMLIEDFAALDLNATHQWLKANDDENTAMFTHDSRERIERARAARRNAFTRLVDAEIAQMETP